MSHEELKSIMGLIDEAKESAKMQRDMITEDLEDSNFDVEKLEELVKANTFPTDAELTEEEVTKYAELLATNTDDPDHKYYELYVEEGDDEEISIRRWLMHGIKSVQDMLKSEANIEELEKEAQDEVKSYTDYLCSEAYDKLRQETLETWKTSLEHETDSAKIRKLKKNIYIVENRFTLGFLFERLNDPKTHDKEHASLVESFFNNNRSNYMMERFDAKCKQFGLSHDVYGYLLDIEERYLEEKYHVYNNFFLFAALRFIGHCDGSEINEAKETIQCMLNLVYSRFYSDEVKEIFLNTIRKFLDEFEAEYDRFDKDNILQPNHPYRIEKKKAKDAETRKKIYEFLEKNGYIEDKENAPEELEEMEIADLISYYNEKVAELDAQKEAEKKAAEAEESDDEEEDEEDVEDEEESDDEESTEDTSVEETEETPSEEDSDDTDEGEIVEESVVDEMKADAE